MSLTKRKDIEIFRALAVIAVILFHSNLVAFKWLYLGVDVFFVISGYLMALLYMNTEPGNFFNRRIRRLLPSLCLVLGTTVFLSSLTEFQLDFKKVFISSLVGVLGIANLYFLSQQSYFDTVNFQPLLHLWSLSLEFQFYLITPFIFKIFKQFGNKILILIATVSLFFYILVENFISEKFAFFLPFGRVWEFLLGVLVVTATRGKEKYSKFGFAAIILFILIFLSSNQFPLQESTKLRLFVILLITFLLYINCSRFFGQKIFIPLVWLGGISYELYLVHFPLKAFLLYEPLTSNQSQSLTNTKNWIGYLLGTLTIALLLQWTIRKFSKKNIVRYTAIFLTIVLLGSSLQIFQIVKIRNQKEYDLAESLSDYDRRRCGILETIKNYHSDFCLVSGSKSNLRKIYLVGDSFTNSLKPLVQQVASEANYSLYINRDNAQLLRNSMTETLKYLSSQDAQRIVFHSSEPLTANEQKQILIFMKESPNRHVMIIGPTPIFNFNVAKQILQDIRKSTPLLIVAKVDLLNGEEFNTPVVQQIGNLTKISLIEMLCNPYCEYSNSESKALYFDHSHITYVGLTKLTMLNNELELFLAD